MYRERELMCITFQYKILFYELPNKTLILIGKETQIISELPINLSAN